MKIFYFERFGDALRESGGGFNTLEEAARAVEHSDRHHTSKGVDDVLARQNHQISFRQKPIEDALFIEVFPDQFSHGEPLAMYKIMEGYIADD